MKLGDAGTHLIQSYEKCRLEAFKPTPDDVPTIGWGHTDGVQMGDTCTQAQADAWFLGDVGKAEDCVTHACNEEPTQNQFDAMVSLCYNIGCRAFTHSTLVTLLNNGNIAGAAAQFLKWDLQAGKILQGLENRRETEKALFLT